MAGKLRLPAGAEPQPIVLNRPLRNPGELGYAYKNPTTTLDFQTSSSADASLLDLFCISPANLRAGVINLNTRNSVAMAAMIAGTIRNEGSTAVVTTANGRNAALDIAAATHGIPALGRHELGRLTASRSKQRDRHRRRSAGVDRSIARGGNASTNLELNDRLDCATRALSTKRHEPGSIRGRRRKEILAAYR